MTAAADNYSDLELSDDEPDSLDGWFSRAANHLKSLVSKLESGKLLELYSYYKQGTEGPCTTPRPRWFDAQGKLKWDAWHALSDLPRDVAKEKYISLIEQLDPDFKRGDTTTRGRTESSWAAVSTLAAAAAEEEQVAEEDKSIFDLSREGCTGRVAELVARRPELGSARDADGLTALHWAADRGHAETAAALLAAGGLDAAAARDAAGQTPLHYAAACGHAATARVLLAAGAERDVRDHDGDTPLDLATDPELHKMLL